MDNGATLECNFEVTKIDRNDGYYTIKSNSEEIKAKIVINASGIYSDKVAQMVGDNSFSVHPRRGEYILLDKEIGNIVSHTIFRTPSKMGKGILVTPTVDGNLLTGPTSVDIEDKENKNTTDSGFEVVINQARENVPLINYRHSITSFTGLRSVGSTGDFIINSPVKGFINVAGIESPGLSAAPAIAEYVRELVHKDFDLKEKDNYIKTRKSLHFFEEATIEEKNEIIKQDSSFGRIICRCEGVTEGEILNAIRTNPKPKDLDGIKRRTRAQMGRCQGGFCIPYITSILAKELNVEIESISKKGKGSELIFSKTKEGC
jgi:glycerol-3-phosphate dehydrogenase